MSRKVTKYSAMKTSNEIFFVLISVFHFGKSSESAVLHFIHWRSFIYSRLCLVFVHFWIFQVRLIYIYLLKFTHTRAYTRILSWVCPEYADMHLLPRPKKDFLTITQNCIRQWGHTSGVLWRIEPPLFWHYSQAYSDPLFFLGLSQIDVFEILHITMCKQMIIIIKYEKLLETI